jgi:hypothetical protein
MAHTLKEGSGNCCLRQSRNFYKLKSRIAFCHVHAELVQAPENPVPGRQDVLHHAGRPGRLRIVIAT